MNKSQDNMKQQCVCPVEATTTNQIYFRRYDQYKMLLNAKKPKSFQQFKKEVWSSLFLNSEEYVDFLKWLKSSKKKIYDRYFELALVDKNVTDKMLTNLNRTTYQMVFSPDIFVPRSEKRRFEKLEKHALPNQYEETTYRTYFNHIKVLDDFRSEFHEFLQKDNMEKFKKEWKTIKYCNRSTYNDEISALGKIYAKPTLPGPIDRYTLRKI